MAEQALHEGIEQIGHAEAGHNAGFLTDEAGWVAVAFFIFVVLFLKYVWPKMALILDARALTIRKELEEAAKLKEEAQALFASAQRQAVEAEKSAEEILRAAKADAKQMVIDAEKEIEADMERKVAQADEKIKRAERNAVENVKKKAIDFAIEAAKEKISAKVSSGKSKDKLIEESISNIIDAVG